jgi:O-methyltransferase involved in polyketide biosynthesis
MKSKISITAEFASLIKSEMDRNNLFFVSKKTLMIGRVLAWFFPKKLLRNISSWRLELSETFDSILKRESPDQIIDFGAGYSLRGFNTSLKNENLTYIDSDLKDVILRKEQIVSLICQKEGFGFPSNLYLLDVDVLKDDLFLKVKNHVLPSSKTLIIAEGVTSYFNIDEFRVFLKKVQSLQDNLSNAIFYSNERFIEPKGLLYKFIRKVLSVFTHSQSGHRFKTKDEFARFLKDCGIRDFKLEDSHSGHLMYSFKI